MRAAVIFSALAIGLAAPASATSLVANGSFESTTDGPGQLGYNTDATGWTTSGYNFLFAPGTADTTGSSGSYGGLSLWGPNNGSSNGLPAASPDGGNFVAMDGDFQTSAVQQTISGLVAGQSYQVSFDYGFGQQFGFDGQTVQHLTVSLGNDSYTTPDHVVSDHGFTGWNAGSAIFTATSTSEVLSFLAYGNIPVPPFALLDGVSMNEVPEPAGWAVVAAGLLGLAGLARMRRLRG